MLKATILQRQGQREDAMATLVEIESRFRDDPIAAEAQWRLAQLTLEQGGRDDQLAARSLYSELVAAHPDSSWAPRAK